MSEEVQILKIKCPHCGWVRRWKVLVTEGNAEVVLGGMNVSDGLKDLAHKIQVLWTDPAVGEADAWVDIPTCPNCTNPYQYNLRSGAAK